MNEKASKSTSISLKPLLVFLIFQAFVLVTWAPLERGVYKNTFESLGIIALPIPYGDFLTISEGVQFYEQGGDPYSEGSYDFIGRRFNYPPVWLEFSFLGMPPEGVRYVYITFATLFSLALALLFSGRGGWGHLGALPFVFSPPVFLALERCNNDLLMFFLIVLGIWILGKSRGAAGEWLASLPLILATILKVFPVFAFYVYLRNGWKKSFSFLVPIGVVCALYFVSIKPILSMIHENTPWSAVLSFGLNVLPYYFSLKLPDSPLIQGPYLLMVAWIVASVLLFIGYRLGKTGIAETSVRYDSFAGNLFRAGGAIYIAAYFMGSNYDYRLIFLLLTLPMAFQMVSSGGATTRWSGSYLVALAIVFWINHGYGEAFLVINELANWCLLFLSIILQFKLLPGFVREQVYRSSAGS